MGECDYDCDSDKDCAAGLWCADAHKTSLNNAGLNNRTAYCTMEGNTGTSEVCFDPNIAFGSIPSGGLAECEYDCDFDSDCAQGLVCADKHKSELAALGYDERRAYCNVPNSGTSEVCYDPRKLTPEILDEAEWKTLKLAEVVAFIDDLKAHLSLSYADVGSLQFAIQEQSV